MKLNDRAEEILETLWVHTKEREKDHLDLSIARGEQAIEELLNMGYIHISNEKITLTEKGSKIGEKIIRRHRLAERLFVDVLDLKKKDVHAVSCQFEHLLYEGIEDNICVLLGHPKFCPHGTPIPPGECCKKFEKQIGTIVSPLSALGKKDKGKIAYIHTRDTKKLQKLLAMGALPGMPISVVQKFPSHVFQVGNSQFAVDKDMADAIYIRLER